MRLFNILKQLAQNAARLPIKKLESTSSAPATFKLTGVYNELIIFGFFQGYGHLFLVAEIVNNTVTLKNMLTGAAYSSAYVTVTKSGNDVSITTYGSSVSYYTVLIAGKTNAK